ncbi:class I SAM-dependent methyltransferase [Aidingimonas halophila]|uniref:Methyltransferase domain-containing protein n=1 Tax=Aidingimonas halophila TaxID=574349 RepID=A0A1H3EAN1_9GAMM|nr:class I SAM-dependent methyltransferase [Aidingimonas halophila]GHC33806.1 hypothetical protein GCM10008094_28310 [Aidingimonas halophila]SDX75803.1 hypothetical protein SAMN05443545_10763 [Aidingimonas halophila]
MTLAADDLAFTSPWLAQREPADIQARNRDLTARCADWLARHRKGTQQHVACLDLGSGAGANPAYLAPRLPGPQSWCLVDNDVSLLPTAEKRGRSLHDAGNRPIRLSTTVRDLRELRHDPLALDDLVAVADLVTASALFDLVSHSWVARLADACARHDASVLFTLSIDGDWAFTEAGQRLAISPEDDWIRETLAVHQYRDKGFGPALGGDAPTRLAQIFSARGYRVWKRPSPWILRPEQPESIPLALAMIQGWAMAVEEQCPDTADRVRAWHRDRHDALTAGTLGLMVGHRDLFAIAGDGE